MYFQEKYTKFFLIIFFFSSINLDASISASCDFNSSDFLEELSKLKNIQKIEINIQKNKKWTKNLMKATLNDGPIFPEYKKKFDAEIKTYYQFGSCVHTGRVRLHGDWKDHIDFIEGGKFVQSLDVSLSNGSIANFVKFKLLIPETRNGKNEIILTHLLRSLDFIAPRTSFVEVAVNGVATNMLIQEKDEKELLEGMRLKEGPLFEGDESFLFRNYKDFRHYDLIDISLSKMTNKQWAQSSFEAARISLKAFSLLQKVYLNYVAALPDNDLYLKWDLLAGNNTNAISKWAHYEILLFAAQASHALLPHNRKFYFNVFNSSFEPIYWDGEPRSLTGEWIRIKPEYKFYTFLEEHHFDELIEMIDLIDEEQFILSLDEEKIIDIKAAKRIFNDLSAKIKILKDEFLSHKSIEIAKKHNIKSNFYETFKDKLISLFPSSIILEIEEDKSNEFHTIQCVIETNFCRKEPISYQEIGEILETKSLNTDHSKPLVLALPNKQFVTSDHQEKLFLNENIKIQSSQDAIISFNDESKKLDIQLSSQDSWAMIYDSSLDNININFSTNFKKKDHLTQSNSRINSRGLSGCLSIYNSNFNETVITANNSFHRCEDTVNIVNSNGTITSMEVNGSFADALDIDFSNIYINLLTISKAENDCVDFSKGHYSLDTVFLTNCGDKAISIGEQSEFSANLVNIERSKIGFASKDSSISSINQSVIQNTETCVDAYQKKQEFFGSVISFNKLQCDTLLIRSDPNSRVALNEL